MARDTDTQRRIAPVAAAVRVKSTLYFRLQSLYDSTIRPHLPNTKWVFDNGVPSPTAKPFDLRLERDWYKAGSILGLRRHLEPTDHLVTIGQERGGPAVVGVRRGHTVTVFEAAKSNVDYLETYFERLKIDDLIDVEHALVADEAIDVFGDDVGDPLPASDLSECDVLEMDVEGAELAILDGLDQRPRAIIIEPHPQHDVSVSDVRDRLSSMGYRTIDRLEPIPGKHVAVVGADYDPNQDRECVSR